MSGIAGIVGWKAAVDEQNAMIQKMRESMRRGSQSITFSEGSMEYELSYDGKLYNAWELQEALEQLGHRFREHSDTEILIHAYIQWKEACVERLNGIFAFTIWEKHHQRLFLARDRVGVKPLFYTHKNGVFLFASEIKGLLAHPLVEPELDINSIAEVILLGPGRTPGCGVFKGIEEVLPGYCGFYEENSLRLYQYWKLEDKPHTDSFGQTVETIRHLLLDSIERQLDAQGAVGTLLSGGLDSSIISSVANHRFRKHGEILHTFSVDYRDNDRFFQANPFQPGNDQPFVEEMVQYLGSTHHRVLLDTDKLVEALYAAVDARDLPGMADIDASLLLFSEKVKAHVDIALSGECADEIFGGYPWYRDKNIRDEAGFPWAKSTLYRTSFLRPEFAMNATYYINERYKKTIADTHVLPDASPLERRMKEMSNLNFQWFMQTLLDRTDRMSMHQGLEVRVPFCDYRIMEYLYTVPWEMKDYQNREKGLLRQAMEGLLPESVLWRKKSPYPKTHNPAYLAAVSCKLKEIIEDPAAPVLQLVRKEALEDLLENNNNSIPWYGQLMTGPQTIAYFLQINYWLGKYQVRF